MYLYPSPTIFLISYTYVTWGVCPDTKRSTSSYCVFLGDNLLSLSSKRQPTLSRSSVEAEYLGFADLVSQSCWLHNIIFKLHCPISKATLVYYDNVIAIYLLSNPVQHQRTKDIERDIHFVRKKVARDHVHVVQVLSLSKLHTFSPKIFL